MTDYDFLPDGIAEFAVWMDNFVINLTVYQAQVGATAAEVTQFQNDALWLQFFAEATEQIQAYRADFSDVKEIFDLGEIGAVMPPAPVLNMSEPPATPAKAGLRKRIRKAAARYKLADGYTSNIGAALGIIGKKPDNNTDFLKPEPKSVTAKPNDEVVIVFSKQGKASALVAEMQREGETKWTRTGTPNASPWTDTTASVGGKAERRHYRFRFLLKNEPVGEYSEIYEVITNP